MAETLTAHTPPQFQTPQFARLARDFRGDGVNGREFTAPPGFAAAVAGDLIRRAREYHAEHGQTWAAWTEPRVALLSELATLIAGRGDRDPLIAGLANYDGGRWEPGRRVEHLLGGICSIPEPSSPGLAAEDFQRAEEATAKLPNANTLLHRLSVATVADVVEEARQIRDRAATELVAVQPDARAEAAELRAAKAEREAAAALDERERAKASEGQLMRENGLLRAELRWHAEQAGSDPEAYVAAILNGLAPEAQTNGQPSAEKETVAPVPDAPLPKGVRQRPNGRYEALVYRSEAADGRQRGEGTHETVEEALAAREAALSREAEAQTEGAG